MRADKKKGELAFALGLAIGQPAEGQDAVDVLDVLGRARRALDHLAHRVPAPLIPAHGRAAGLQVQLLLLLRVPLGLLVGDVLDKGLEHEMTAGALHLLKEIGVADRGNLFIDAHGCSRL